MFKLKSQSELDKIEREELLVILNNCIYNSNNQDLRTILDCLGEIGYNVRRY